jgi:SAM-dependent methyltransferase
MGEPHRPVDGPRSESGAAALRESREAALARLYDLDLAEDPGDLDLYLALAARSGGPIMELAVGTGRVAVPLALAGHEVTGIDRDPAMLERARRAWAAARTRGKAAVGGTGADSEGGSGHGRLELVEADILEPRLPERGGFRLVILALNSLLLFPERGLQARVVQTMANLLVPGGLAVIDAWQPEPADLVRLDGRLTLEWLRQDRETGEEITKTIAGRYDGSSRSLSLTTIFEGSRAGSGPGPATASGRWIREDRMRLADGDDLVAFAEAAGLAVEQLAGDYGLGPFDGSSERAILVARR